MEISKHQKFTMREMLRSEIREHPKNPRVIADAARKKLKGKMAEVGLLQPLIVNEITGYLLGGHQRLASLDALERYKPGKNDYKLDVAVVSLDEKDELAMLIFLNNPSSQGSWQTDMLAEINLEAGISFEDMGFDQLDVNLLFDGDSRFSEAFADTQEVRETKGHLDEIKAARGEATEKLEKAQQAEFYFVVVCRDDQERKDLLKRMKIPAHERYVSADALSGALK